MRKCCIYCRIDGSPSESNQVAMKNQLHSLREAEDMLRAYELAEKGSLLPVSTSWPSNRVPFASAPPSSVIEAQ